MKLEYTISSISGKKKALCVGDLIKYYGEHRYKLIDAARNLSNDKTTKGLIVNLIKKIATNNAAVDMMLNHVEELAKKKIFKFTIDGFDPVQFDNGTDSCVLVLEMDEEWFIGQAMGAMVRPGFRKFSFEQHLEREKDAWRKYIDDNLRNDYSKCFTCRVLE
jgi:hypothetical protein